MGSTQSRDPRLQEVTVGAGSGVWGQVQVIGGGVMSGFVDLFLVSWLMFFFCFFVASFHTPRASTPPPPVSVGGATVEGQQGRHEQRNTDDEESAIKLW